MKPVRLGAPGLLGALLSAVGGGPARVEATDVGASVAGKVSFEGTAPPAERIRVANDTVCQALHPQGIERRAIDVQGGGLVGVLVYVKTGLRVTPSPPTEAAVLDQQGCAYVPPLVVVQVGQPLKIRNSDSTFHNVHTWSTVNPAFNIAQPRKGMETTRTFDRPEVLVPVRCDMHSWMHAEIAVLPHPFHSVTGPGGTFTIKGLSEGEYEIEAVHARLKSVTAKVSVRDGATARVDFSLKD